MQDGGLVVREVDLAGSFLALDVHFWGEFGYVGQYAQIVVGTELAGDAVVGGG